MGLHTTTIVRHAPSAANKHNANHSDNRLFGGDTDYPLATDAAQKTAALRDQFEAEGRTFDTILSSPLRRSVYSALILGDGQTVKIVDALTERRLGKISGLTREQVSEQFTELRELLITDPDLTTLRESFAGYPKLDIEGYAEVIERLRQGLPPEADDEESRLIVTHKHTARALIHVLLGWNQEQEITTTNLDIPNLVPIDIVRDGEKIVAIKGLKV